MSLYTGHSLLCVKLNQCSNFRKLTERKHVTTMKFNFVQIKLNVKTVVDSTESLQSALQGRGHLNSMFSKIIQEQDFQKK